MEPADTSDVPSAPPAEMDARPPADAAHEEAIPRAARSLSLLSVPASGGSVFTCALCNNPFEAGDPARRAPEHGVPPHVPLLLLCGDSFCAPCLWRQQTFALPVDRQARESAGEQLTQAPRRGYSPACLTYARAQRTCQWRH